MIRVRNAELKWMMKNRDCVESGSVECASFLGQNIIAKDIVDYTKELFSLAQKE